ncbi:MAG: hypothetical protein QG580_397 [Patescibacteria group bacterium]|jgi:hypothetical protein|nr:hypothetical protein [Patescibacteria group bacterium]
MNLNFIRKIFLGSFVGLFLPLFAFAQSGTQIQNISWNLDSTNPFSVSGGGTMTLNGNTWQQISNTFKWQIQWGYAGNYTPESGSNASLGGESVFMGYIPNNATPTNLFTSTASHLSQVPGTNQYVFNIPSVFQNVLWPASNYYFDIIEWDQAGTDGTRRFFEGVVQTDRLNPSSVTLNVNQGSNNAYLINFTVNGPQNILNSMPVSLYITNSQATGAVDTAPQNPIWAGTATFSQNTLNFSIPSGILNTGTNYYLRIINAQPGAGGLSLLDQDILINVPAPTTPPSGGGSQNPTNPNTDQGDFASPDDFSNGIVNCDGVNVECNFERLLDLVNRSVNFVIFIIGIPLVALSFVYAGFLMATSGGSSGKKDQAKAAISGAVTGLIILLAAWLIVRTVLLVFGYQGPLLGILGAN